MIVALGTLLESDVTDSRMPETRHVLALSSFASLIPTAERSDLSYWPRPERSPKPAPLSMRMGEDFPPLV